MSTEMDMDGPFIKSGMPAFSKKTNAPQKSANEELDPNNIPELKEHVEKSESIFGSTKTQKHMEARENYLNFQTSYLKRGIKTRLIQ